MSTMEILLIVLNSVILPLCAWTLYTVHTLAKALAVEAVYGQTQTRDLVDMRTRLTSVEAQIMDLRLKLEGRNAHARH